MKPYIYLRALRYAEHTVFGVQNGQKTYRDPQFGRDMAYSSGQQVKRSIIESLTTKLNVPYAAITFNYEIKGKKREMKQPWHPCDPTYVDQLIGGYMRAESESLTVKRRSPLSISAMRPLHPLLGGLEREKEAANFDRKGQPIKLKTSDSELELEGVNNVRVFAKSGKTEKELSKAELDKWLSDPETASFSAHYYKPDSQTRATGLFVYDIAIDLRTLFCVSLNELELEISSTTQTKLREAGWVDGNNVFGKCLILPKEQREKIIPSLAHALVNWRITSNQARTFSLMETMAIAISDNANQIAYAIRGELREDVDRQAAVPRIDETAKADIFITSSCSSRIQGAVGSADAIDKAEAELVKLMMAFDYENQVI